MKIVGIDLGTTNSCIYYLDDAGNPQLVMAQKRYKFFPSAVWSNGPGKDVVVGHAAKAQMGRFPSPVIAVKRKMGTTETVALGGQQVSPVDVSVHILKYARQLVEETTGDQIGGAIITVPAYFDSAPKNDTYLAGVKAFFEGDDLLAKGRLELQLEPEAAAYAYASEDSADQLRVLVYDLGGGTFDVTTLEKSPDAGLSVIKFGGDPHLGGDNIDDRIALWFLYLLRGGNPEAINRILDPQRYPADEMYLVLQDLLANEVESLGGRLRIEDHDLMIGSNPPYDLELDLQNPADISRIQTLKRLAEKAKIDLSSTPETLVAAQQAFSDHSDNAVEIDFTLSRLDFDRLIGDMIATTIKCVHKVLDESKLSPAMLDKVLLVGGSSRTPLVKEELQKIFACPILLADPDLIVARGAVLRARALNPPPLGVRAGEEKLALEFPRETPEVQVTIRGVLAKPMSGHAFLMQGQTELDHAPVSQTRFQFTEVTLEPETKNHFHIEVVDAHENLFAAADAVIRHSAKAISSGDRVAPKITKPIRALSTKGYHTLFQEGQTLPVTGQFPCFRATQDDHIEVEFYEGERHLSTLRITNVDSALPVGAAIDLAVTVGANYAVSAQATVRDTRQTETVEFEITRLAIPPLAQMDKDLEATLAQIDNDLEHVNDMNRRLEFHNKTKRLEAEYKMARGALTPDLHKLYTTIGELRTALIEVRTAQMILEPPLEEVIGLCRICRGLLGRLPEEGAVRKQDALERIVKLEAAARAVWDRQDEPEYKQIAAELGKFHAGLSRALQEATPGGRESRKPFSPLELQRGILGWLAELREKASKNGLLQQFGGDIDALQRNVRSVELRDEERGRAALFEIIDRQMRPLDYKIDQAIESKGGRPTASKAKVSF
jgi:hypothetical protein